MAAHKLTPEVLAETLALVRQYESVQAASQHSGVAYNTFASRYRIATAAQKRGELVGYVGQQYT